ncbi:MAG: radical SAM protein [Nanoarchaeota archaeon]|nr:radical SAM protein [Nanoarchaeota archaeon]MBU1321000.1 radical SAM protein [Nanoarchaeota archaeon]MBU1596871.1 radical SAM protein [Nanoarchaeota archaeon]MBU2440790.1 radical SAM protein [Nanoarchaeota archaeon]
MKYVQLSFNLTGRCNLSCAYCAVNGGESKTPDTKPKAIIKGYRKIRKMHPSACIDLNCMGEGEPLLNWEGIETIDNIKRDDKNTRCFITTNGTQQKRVLELARRNWIITVSYDGVHNESLRGQSEIVQNTINTLAKTNADFLVRITFAPESLSSLEDSLDNVKQLGVEYVVLGPVFPFGKYRAKEVMHFDINKLYESITYAEKIGLKAILSIQEQCTLATKGYYAMPDGNISICYVKFIKPTIQNRKKAEIRGCILYDYNNLIKEEY